MFEIKHLKTKIYIYEVGTYIYLENGRNTYIHIVKLKEKSIWYYKKNLGWTNADLSTPGDM